MSPCKFAHTLSELTVCRAPPNMNCRTISTVMTVRLSVAEVCRSLYCDSPEHCAWLASTSAHKQLLVARPGTVGWYFFICSMVVLQWDPATCAASACFVLVTQCLSTHISDVVGYVQLILGRFFSTAHRFSHCTILCMHYNGHV